DEPVGQATPRQQIQGAGVEVEAPAEARPAGTALDQDRLDPGEPELAGEEEPGRAGSDDEHVDHCAPFPDQVHPCSVRSTCGQDRLPSRISATDRCVQASSASEACNEHSTSIMNSRGTRPEPTVSA